MTGMRQNAGSRSGEGPRRPFNYSEDSDESPTLLEEEPVDIEESTPADKRDSVESVEPDDADEPPVFEQ